MSKTKNRKSAKIAIDSSHALAMLRLVNEPLFALRQEFTATTADQLVSEIQRVSGCPPEKQPALLLLTAAIGELHRLGHLLEGTSNGEPACHDQLRALSFAFWDRECAVFVEGLWPGFARFQEFGALFGFQPDDLKRLLDEALLFVKKMDCLALCCGFDAASQSGVEAA